jgi:putative SOS response-associated peptidase YedK
MCGRLVITEPDLSVFVAPFGVQQVDVLEWAPRFNLAPTELAPLITNEPKRRLTLARFGLVPSWADDRKAGGKWINARVETVATAKPFRRALALRRGVIPVSGYYEWRVTPHGKRAVYIHDPSGNPLILAGVWECWHARASEGAAVESFAILTRAATDALGEIHDRMPFQLELEDLDGWLDPEERSPESLLPILGRAARTDHLALREVSALVNSVKNDGPELLEPRGDESDAPRRQLELFESIAATLPRAR